MFSAHFLFIFGGSFDYTCSRTIFLTRSQNNVQWITRAEELKNSVLYMIMSICKVVTLIFYVLAEWESKKMWSKFDNVTPALEILQNSQENTYARISFLIKAQVFSREFCEISKNVFSHRTPSATACVCSSENPISTKIQNIYCSP